MVGSAEGDHEGEALGVEEGRVTVNSLGGEEGDIVGISLGEEEPTAVTLGAADGVHEGLALGIKTGSGVALTEVIEQFHVATGYMVTPSVLKKTPDSGTVSEVSWKMGTWGFVSKLLAVYVIPESVPASNGNVSMTNLWYQKPLSDTLKS